MNKKILLIILLITSQFLKLFAKEETYINTKNLTYDQNKNIVIFSEETKININDTNINLNKGYIDYKNDLVVIDGNFYLSQNKNILSGDNLKSNLKLDNFSANKVNFIYENTFKIDSESIQRKKNEISFLNNFVTACKLDGYFNCPTWSLRVKETNYDFVEDKFIHYDSFLQIADYKVLYLPYLSHYGTKADRKRGFLTPSAELTIGKDNSFKLPYYIPLDKTSDLTITPKIIFNSLDIGNSYSIASKYNKKNKNGYINIDLENIKKTSESSLYSNWEIDTYQVIDRNNVLKIRALFTNSISTSRSLNEEPVPFKDLSFSIERYESLFANDYTKFEVSSVESFDQANNDLIPTNSSIYYESILPQNNKISISNKFQMNHITRNFSTNDNPSESIIFNIDNDFMFNNRAKNFLNLNKIIISNNFYNYQFTHDEDLNRNENNNFISASSEVISEIFNDTQLTLKLIHNQNLVKTKSIINEQNKSVTFNYNSQLNQIREFGSDMVVNSSRAVYALEHKFNIDKINLDLKLNQSYDFKKNTDYLSRINQLSNLSDYAVQFHSMYDKFNFTLDARLDQTDLRKKEMNYEFEYSEDLNITASYNETSEDAFKNISNNSKSLNFSIHDLLNDNVSYSLNSSLDLKNDYSPYSNKLTLNFFDECSNLEIYYENRRFNDNFNTTPEEKIGVSFTMDYIGYFGIEQRSSLFQ